MNLNDAEEDEKSLLSPVLSTKHNPLVVASEPFQTIQPEFGNDEHDLCSPVLDGRTAQELKPKKSNPHQSLMTDKDFSVNFSAVRDLDPQVLQPGTEADLGQNDKFEKFGSPEHRSNQGMCQNLVSPEVKIKKIHLNSTSGRKKRMKFNEIPADMSLSERNSLAFASTSSNISSKQQNVESSFIKKDQCKLPENIIKKLDSKEERILANLKLDHAIGNDSLNEAMKNPLQAAKSMSNQDKMETGPGKLNEISMFDEANSSVFLKCRKSLEKSSINALNNDSETECVPELGVPVSPILKTKSLTSEKRKKRLNNDEKKIEQGGQCLTLQDDYSKRNLLTSQTRLNIMKTAPNASQKFDSKTFSCESNESKICNNVGQKISSTFSPPFATHEAWMQAQSKNSTHKLSPTNSHSPFGEKLSDFTEGVSSLNCANISHVRKRLGFHPPSAEKSRSKGIKSLNRLNLKKTNNLENQFSKFSQFCKLNTSLSTKSPSNLTIRKSKMKKFNVNKEESSFRKSSNYSENYCDFDRSPSPVLESCINLELKTDISQDKFDVASNKKDPFKMYESPQDRIKLSQFEYFIEDQADDKSLSPCLRTTKNFVTNSDFSRINSKCYEVPKTCVKKFKFGPNEAKHSNSLDNGEECYDLNESLSPVLEVRKNLVLESDHKVTPCNIDEDHEDPLPVEIHDATIVNMNDKSMLDDGKILNDTILETNQETVAPSSRVTIGVDDDVIISASAISKSDQDSMTIEFSESSGTQREPTAKTPTTPPQNLPLNDDDIYESRKKKKRRFKNGTLSARLNKLVKRVKSETRMWAHEQQNDLPSSAAIDLVVDTVAYEMNKWLLKCRIISKPVTDDCSDIYFVILHPSAISNSLVSPGIILRIFPKWQTLDLPFRKITVIFNTTRVKLIKELSSAHSSNLAPVVKKNVEVAEAYCSCPRDSVLTMCVHSLLRRQTVLGPLLFPENEQ